MSSLLHLPSSSCFLFSESNFALLDSLISVNYCTVFLRNLAIKGALNVGIPVFLVHLDLEDNVVRASTLDSSPEEEVFRVSWIFDDFFAEVTAIATWNGDSIDPVSKSLLSALVSLGHFLLRAHWTSRAYGA